MLVRHTDTAAVMAANKFMFMCHTYAVSDKLKVRRRRARTKCPRGSKTTETFPQKLEEWVLLQTNVREWVVRVVVVQYCTTTTTAVMCHITQPF